MRIQPAWFTLLLLGGFVPGSMGHDFWIEPSTFTPAAAKRFDAALRVGDHFVGEPVARSRARIIKFAAFGDKGEIPIAGREGADPAGICRIDEPGYYTLGYRSNHAFVELEPAKFEKYLREEGLETIIEERRRRGEAEQIAREAYSRCSKTLITVGDAPSTKVDRTLGFTLELIAEGHSSAFRANSDVRFQLLFQGKPLENALITAHRKGTQDEQKLSARSDADGRVSFKLADGGVWLIASVHMIRAESAKDYQWESFWASLTFEVPTQQPIATEPTPATR